MSEKIIVTGVNGFVGEHVVDTFKEDGFEVVGIGSDNNPNEKVAHKLDTYVSCNLLDVDSVNNIDLNNARAIIHLAGLSAVSRSFDQAQRYISDNAVMTYNLLDHAKTSNMQGRAIVVSSGALYDPNQPLPISEESATSPTSPYAIGKLASEHVVDYFRNRGLDAVIARPFNHIGPGQKEGFILPDIYAQLSSVGSGGEIQVGNLNTRRDYTDVRDIVAGYKALALAESLDHNLYNICSGKSLSGKDILALVERIGGYTDIKVSIDPSKIRPSDIVDIYGDSSRIRNELGWQPQYDIEQTITDFVAESSRDK
jgi:NAD-dependent epimerase/dehydratase